MDGLAGRTVMITGAAGGIGKAMAECFAATGARLALVDMHDPSELASRLGADHKGFVLDLEDTGAITSVVDQIGAAMGIDILVNNAGLGIVFPVGNQISKPGTRRCGSTSEVPGSSLLLHCPISRLQVAARHQHLLASRCHRHRGACRLRCQQGRLNQSDQGDGHRIGRIWDHRQRNRPHRSRNANGACRLVR